MAPKDPTNPKDEEKVRVLYKTWLCQLEIY